MKKSKSLLAAVMVGLACLASAAFAHANAPPATLGYQLESVQVAQPNVLDLFLSPVDVFANGTFTASANCEVCSNQVTSPSARPVANAPPQLVATAFPTQAVLSADNSCVTTAVVYDLDTQSGTLSLGQEVPAVFCTSTASA